MEIFIVMGSDLYYDHVLGVYASLKEAEEALKIYIQKSHNQICYDSEYIEYGRHHIKCRMLGNPAIGHPDNK